MNQNVTKTDILNDPSVHNWVKEALVKLENHDIVDVILDLDILTCYFEKKAKSMGLPI